ncbi:MAG: Gldg family protein, partial [Planctomycetota bacterium JB042]
AIFDVTRDERATIYTITGHEELSVASAADLGGSLLAAALGADNAAVEPLSLVARGEVPDDAAAVLLLGPQHSSTFLDEEKTALDAYLRRGGKLLVAVDPLGNRQLDETIFRPLGLELERNLICHTQKGVLRGSGVTEMWVAGREAPGRYGRHEITRTLIEDNEVFMVVRSGGVSAAPGHEAAFTSLLLSPEDAFGDLPKSEIESGDLKQDPRIESEGTRTLAAAIEPTGPYAGAKVVFVPAVPWATNYMIRRSPGNERFLRRAVKWLVGKGDASIVLPPQTVSTRIIEVPEGEEDSIFLYTAVYLPLGALALALVVWLARRK